MREKLIELPLKTMAAEAPITAKKGEYSGVSSLILEVFYLEPTRLLQQSVLRLGPSQPPVSARDG